MEYEFQKKLKTLKSVVEKEPTVVPNANPTEIARVRQSLKGVNPDPGTSKPSVPSEIQRAIGKLTHMTETGLEKLVREIGEGRHKGDEGTRKIAGMAGSLRSSLKREVNEKVGQVMSGMVQAAWNASYSWRARFALYLINNELLVEIRAKVKPAPGCDENTMRYTWQREIGKKWQNLAFIWKDYGTGGELTIPVRVVMTWENNALMAHCQVTPNLPGGGGMGGTHGVGGTTSMTSWGTGDPLDIPHEVGHMLGAPDNYGKIDFKSEPIQSIDWPKGRVNGLGIMNNPAEYPCGRSVWLVVREFQEMMIARGKEGEVYRIIDTRVVK
jgi:hypothetical protein